jgi:hypothetical protein
MPELATHVAERPEEDLSPLERADISLEQYIAQMSKRANRLDEVQPQMSLRVLIGVIKTALRGGMVGTTRL